MAALARRASDGAAARAAFAPSSPRNGALPRATLALLRECAHARADAMDALRIAAGTISLESSEPTAIVAKMPTIVAAYARLADGHEPIAPRADLGHAANYLYMLTGDEPDAERDARARDLSQHGRRSRAERVDVHLPRHHVDRIGPRLGDRRRDRRAQRTAARRRARARRSRWCSRSATHRAPKQCFAQKIEGGDRLMGFGHRVYKVRDPRADVLGAAAERLFTRAGDMSLYTLARSVEATALRLLEEYKPGRRLQTNVEFYTALLLHGLGARRPALHADVRDRPRERLDRARAGAARQRAVDSSELRIRRAARPALGRRVERASPRPERPDSASTHHAASFAVAS